MQRFRDGGSSGSRVAPADELPAAQKAALGRLRRGSAGRPTPTRSRTRWPGGSARSHPQRGRRAQGSRSSSCEPGCEARQGRRPSATRSHAWSPVPGIARDRSWAFAELLANNQPAPTRRREGFDHGELRGLRLLRGRASHTQSKAGVQESITFVHECSRRLARVSDPVELVSLTNNTWGSLRATLVEELAPLHAYAGRNGAYVIFSDRER
jgi:hypothetical protein